MDLLLAKWAKRQTEELGVDDVRSAVAGRHARNKEAAVQSEWRTSPFLPRVHEQLRGNDRPHMVGGGLSGPDARRVDRDLRTSIPDRVVGALYLYDEAGTSEDWMRSVGAAMSRAKRSAAVALARDDGVVCAQVTATLEAALLAVQDRAATERDVPCNAKLRSNADAV
mgnify:CR=1 FL=1